MKEPLLCEVAWEVCQQLGGIYTVVRSKVPAMVNAWGERYGLVGPYNAPTAQVEFEESAPEGPFGAAAQALRQAGFDAHYGRWLVTGRPQVVLLDTRSCAKRLNEIKYFLWERHGVSLIANDPLVDQVAVFGFLVEQFFRALAPQADRPIVAHFHEWMGGTAIPEIRRQKLPVGMVFTTHATLLGRYLAMSDPGYYDALPATDWLKSAQRFAIEPQVRFERLAARDAHVFTTVSRVTALECEHLLGRKPDMLLPNGLNIERFAALHEFQNLHRAYKEKIHQFVMGHFFPSYTFDLDRTVYLLTSGRYEYVNKGFDLTIDALTRLNWQLKQEAAGRTVVCFIVTRAPWRSINPEALRTRAVMQEIRSNCQAIQEQVGSRLFQAAAMGQSPALDSLVDDYWRLRLRRNVYAWRSDRLPGLVTHDLADEAADPILRQLRAAGLENRPEDPVKVVYHPDFITSSNPLFAMDYDQFVRGCHLGIFPSLYEPWGYAPLECAALGVPSITSDMAGFGAYVQENVTDHEERGLMVVRRRHVPFDAAAADLAQRMHAFSQLERRERIALRNRVEEASAGFDWQNLGRHYAEAHRKAEG